MNMSTPKNKVQQFMDWWEKLPLWYSIVFFPIVMMLYIVAIIINKFRGEK